MLRIEIRGDSKRQEEAAHKVLDALIEKINADSIGEPKARLMLQEKIDEHRVLATVMLEGNSVWSKRRVLSELKSIRDRGGEISISDYLYNFFSLCCGSIAHYNKHGWIGVYPTVEDLKAFFVKNEYGQSILEHMPLWKTDCIEIAKGIFDLFEIPYTK